MKKLLNLAAPSNWVVTSFPNLNWDITVESLVAVGERGCQVGRVPAETWNRVNYPWCPTTSDQGWEGGLKALALTVLVVLESDQPEGCWTSTSPQSRKLKRTGQDSRVSGLKQKLTHRFPLFKQRERKLHAQNFPSDSRFWADDRGGDTVGESIY